MLKKYNVKKILASVMAAAMLFTAVPVDVGGIQTVYAASEYQNANLLVNPDFEDSLEFGEAAQSELGNWYVWNSAGKTTQEHQSGDTAVKLSAGDTALEQDVNGLQNGMTYVYSVWAKLSKEGNSSHYVGVKNFGGSEVKVKVTSTEWQKYDLEFVPTNGNVRVYGWVDQHNGIDLYLDHTSLTVKSEIQKAEIANGAIDVTFADTFDGAVTEESFSAVYRTSADTNAKELPLKAGELTGNRVKLTFAPVEAIAVEQTVTVELTYQGQTITLDYMVEASGEEVIEAAIASVTAENGSVSVVLEADPTVIPTAETFTWQYKTGAGEPESLKISGFSYDKQSKTAAAEFEQFRGIPGEEQRITLIIGCNGKTEEAAFYVPAATANTYYVSASGSDENDGLSEEKPIASIEKLNTLTFVPGDRILFKKGDTFTGCFKPKGSGVEGAPITIGVYGEGEKRPVLQPGDDWTISHIMSADNQVLRPTVNYVLWFYNVEHWEVQGLELADPDPFAYDEPVDHVYRSGISIQGEDIGTLEHIYIDDLIIHGFHGPRTNIGKTTGGITMNVITNYERNREKSVPTQINDIRITNCEIYDVGRSGINFLTPWSWRSDEKWGPFNYGRRGYDYLPYEDFYMANNYIHDVDGDGAIIDNCAGAVCENNLVTRCCKNPASSSINAAVGLFNWNSDDTIFQFNEVYDIWPGTGGRNAQSGDNQGIEIDALNDRTLVQYNYVHDNHGGFMMLCNVSDSYRSFDGIIRYNISQNDYAHSSQGLFDLHAANYGTEVYNNTFYLTERTLNSSGKIFLFQRVAAREPMKFYNNIFYYDGETPAEANTFGDGAIDWESNIFYGFKNLPENDSAGAPNISADPMIADIGKGGNGTKPGEFPDLSCYYLTEESPAINGGIPIENNGGRDFFGNPVSGIPDIGAYESGTVSMTVSSKSFAVDQEAKTITAERSRKATAKDLLDSLITENDVKVFLKRGSSVLEGGVRLADGDVLEVSYEGKTILYVIRMADGEVSDEIPAADCRATAGTQEISGENGRAENVLDGNTGTIWHSQYVGGSPSAKDKYLTIELTKEYQVSGYVYTPRQDGGSGAANGLITKYEIYTSDDNNTWEKAAEGVWSEDNKVKTAVFDLPVQAKYVKLQAVESVGGFVSAAEVRLKGTPVYDDKTAPDAPAVKAEEITETSAKISWNVPEDSDAAEFILMDGEKVIAEFDETVRSYTVSDLVPGQDYVFSVYALDIAGNRSEAGTVKVTTQGKTENPFPDVTEQDYFYQAVMWALKNGITEGVGNTGKFMPDQDCSRAQVVAFLWKQAGRPEPSGNPEYSFRDVDQSDWYYQPVMWAAENGIVKGMGNTGKFMPDQNCSRAQVVTFLYRAAGSPEFTGDPADSFSDVTESDYFYQPVMWAAENGIVKGMGDTGKFMPDRNCSRAHIVTFMNRAAEKQQ